MSIDSNTANSLLLATNAATLIETLLYGIHFVLFCICIFILLRNGRPKQWFILVSAIVMFALSTADVALTFRFMTHDIIDVLPQNVLAIFCAKNLIFVSNNFIAELTLSYRCYMIWGRPKSLLFATSILVLSDTVWGFFSLGSIQDASASAPVPRFLPVYLWSVFAINILISGITIGRILWVAHVAKAHLGRRNLRHFHFIIATLVETSVVYSACLLSFLVLIPQPTHPGQMITQAIGIRVVAIMPTLLIVQVGLVADRTAGGANDSSCGTRSIVLDTVVITTHENRDTSGLIGMHARDTLDSNRQDSESL